MSKLLNQRSPLLQPQIGQEDNHEAKSGFWVTVLNIVKACVGTSMLSLPWAFAGGSLIPSMIVLCLSSFSVVISIVIIVLACEELKAFNVPALLKEFPPWLTRVMEVSTFIMCLIQTGLALVSYIVLAADSMIKVIPGLSRTSWSLLFAFGIYFPLCLMKLKDLWFTSAVGLSAAFYTFVLICVYSGPPPVDYCFFEFNMEWFTVAGVSTQAVCLFYCIPPMYENLENRSVKKFSKATITAFIICTIFYGAFSSIAYLNFGNASLGDILLNLPENLASHVARFGQLICVLGSYPLIFLGTITTIEGQFFGEFSSQFQRVGTIFGLHVIFLSLSLVLPDLGVLNSINGGLAIATLTFIFPALFAIYILHKSTAAFTAYALFGVLVTIASILYASRPDTCSSL